MNTRRLRVALMVGILSSVAVTANAQRGPEPQRLTLAEAQKIIDTAHKAAADMNLRLSIAVVDARGDLIALGRMPGAGAGTTDTAIGKAMLSAIYGQPSLALVGRASNPATQGLNEASGGRLRFLQGAVPIIRGGYVVGAVAGSGATGQQDEQIAAAGLAGLP
jgi:glc operon protein GlcG